MQEKILKKFLTLQNLFLFLWGLDEIQTGRTSLITSTASVAVSSSVGFLRAPGVKGYGRDSNIVGTFPTVGNFLTLEYLRGQSLFVRNYELFQKDYL